MNPLHTAMFLYGNSQKSEYSKFGFLVNHKHMLIKIEG